VAKLGKEYIFSELMRPVGSAMGALYELSTTGVLDQD
jgi:hypothetical protein